jgi:hypothetical protein
MSHKYLAALPLSICGLLAAGFSTNSSAGVDPFEFQVYGYQTQGKNYLDWKTTFNI